jgi:hypothetical protein
MYFTGIMESTSKKPIVGERKLTVCSKIEKRKYEKRLQKNQKRKEERRNEQDGIWI